MKFANKEATQHIFEVVSQSNLSGSSYSVMAVQIMNDCIIGIYRFKSHFLLFQFKNFKFLLIIPFFRNLSVIYDLIYF
jgi:hypothetical protein